MVTAACTPTTSNPANNLSVQVAGTYEINPALREFYNLAGGETVLGPAISTMFVHESKLMQYVHAGLMVYDPSAITGSRYYLAPLGVKAGISETPNATFPAERHVDGFPLYHEFSALYDQLARFAGTPLSNPLYNPANNRWEQYFQNVGFYFDLDNPELGPRLLGYGSFDCEYACRYTPPDDSSIGLQLGEMAVPSPFYEAVERLGSTFAGTPLTGVYINVDGNQEMIFSNVILYFDERAGRVFARDMARELGFRHPATADNGSDAFNFYPVEGTLGYNVAIQVQAYISQHGGLDIAGLPITDMFLMNDQWWQCFTNLCVVYDASQPEELRIHAAALGGMYKSLFFDNADAQLLPDSAQGAQNGALYGFSVFEEKLAVDAGETQTIHVKLEQGETSNAVFELALYIPGEAQQTFTFPPTNEAGESSLTLPAIIGPEITYASYTVCYEGTCIKDGYVIWNEG